MFDLRPLHSGAFRHLAAAYWVNEFGNWVGEVALALLVYDRTHSALATAALFLAMRFAPSLLAPLLTVRVEAISATAVLVSIYVLEALLFGALAIISRHFSEALTFGLVACDGVLAITAKALTRSAAASQLLESGLLRQGNGILNLGVMISTAGAPVIASVMIAWRGAGTALAIDAGTFVVAALAIGTASGLRIESDSEAGFKGRLRAGFDVLRTRVAVRRLMIGIACAIMLCSVPVPVDVVFAERTLHAGATGYGLMLMSWGVAMIAGGAVFGRATETRLVKLLGVSTAVIATGYAGLALAPSLAVACAFSAIGGAGNGTAWVAAVTAVQERIPASAQPAVMSVLEGMSQAMPALGFAIGGAITALASPRAAYALAGGGVAVVIGLFSLWRIDNVQLDAAERSDRLVAIPRDLVIPQEMPIRSRTVKPADPSIRR